MIKKIAAFSVLTLFCVESKNLAIADVVHSDDVITTGSLCVGFDCLTDGTENFGFSTIKMKENNTRITFDDTSTTSGFPANDWELTANDSNSGGGSYFAITDVTAGRRLFQVDAGAPSLSMHIDSAGNLNLASSTARITNLDDPIDATDAVNLRTLNATVASGVPWISSSSTTVAHTSGSGSTALGAGASARTNDTAVGYYATVTADNSTAVGAHSLIQSENSVAIGENATVEAGAEGGTALGQNARVASGATNSVALGKDSIASEPNTVSIGSPGNERRITNVAAGIHTTDAVNKGQLDGVSSRVDINTRNIAKNTRNIALHTQDIQENSADIAHNSLEIDQLQDDMEDSYAGIAAAASLITLSPSAPGKTTINLGGANFKSESAIGLTLAHRLNSAILGDDISLNCGISVANGETLTRIGGSWEF